MASPTRDELLRDVQGGMTIAAAAQKHGVPLGTAKSWCHRAKAGASGAQPRNPAPAGNAGGKRVDEPDTAAPSSSRARAKAGTLTPLLGEELRGYLREGTRGLARFIAKATSERLAEPVAEDEDEDDDGPDMHQVAAAARALKELVGIAPDILTFDEKTGGRVDGDGTARREAAVARVRGLLGTGGPGDG